MIRKPVYENVLKRSNGGMILPRNSFAPLHSNREKLMTQGD